MKSFIKSHKRSESSQSASSGAKTGPTTPSHSPLIQQSSNGTFSLNSGFNSNTTLNSNGTYSSPNSPKKLLSPIKNLFQKRRSNESIPTISTLSKISQNSLSKENIPNKAIVKKNEPISKPKPKTKAVPVAEPIDSDSEGSIGSNNSKFSFVQDMKGGRNTSIKYYKTKTKVMKDIPRTTELDNYQDMDIDDYDYDNNGLDDYDIEEDLEEDIHYIDDFEEPHKSKHLNIDDDDDKGLVSHIEEYDDDDPNDYDYDEDLDEQDHDEYYIHQYQLNEENNRRYNQAYFETESILTLPHNKVPFHKSYHLSIDGTHSSSQELSDDYDVLDSYLDVDDVDSDEKSQAPMFESIDNLELYDLNSPLINGLTIGGDMNYRFRGISRDVRKYKTKIKSFHYSIDEVALMKNLEDSEEEEDSEIGLGLAKLKYQGWDTDLSRGASGASRLSKGSRSSKGGLEQVNGEDPVKGLTVLETFNGGNSHENDIKNSHENGIDIKNTHQNGIDIKDTRMDAKETHENGINENKPKREQPFQPLSKEIATKINRKSINEMMNLLDNLQIDNHQGQKNKRNSIENMMTFLQNIQKSQKNQIIRTPTPSRTPSRTDSQSARIKPLNKESKTDFQDESFKYQDDLNDLEKDLLDEINQLPADFDFDVNPDLVNQFNQLNNNINNSFMRSNSFNKKPKKVLASTVVNNNKIETVNRTVTYYNKSNLQYESNYEDDNNLSTISEGKS